MKGKLGETRKNVHFLTRRGDVKKKQFPTKQANQNLKGALYKSAHIISADVLIGRSAMSTRTGGAIFHLRAREEPGRSEEAAGRFP